MCICVSIHESSLSLSGMHSSNYRHNYAYKYSNTRNTHRTLFSRLFLQVCRFILSLCIVGRLFTIPCEMCPKLMSCHYLSVRLSVTRWHCVKTASNIRWRHATPCRPANDCKMNDLEWPWVAILWQNAFSASTSWIRAFESLNVRNSTTSAILRCSVHCTIS